MERPTLRELIYNDREFVNETSSSSRMVFDLLSISLISVEYEYIFSSVKLLITERRNRLKDDIIEVCTCLRSWYKEKLKNETPGRAPGGSI
jgi:hypothetical protein